MPLLFPCAWGIGAIALGWIFTFRTESLADAYEAQMAPFRLTDRLRRLLAPRWFVRGWYRVGGVCFMVLGVVLPILGLTNVIPVSS